jgi:regulator of RNase E activity RraA
MPANDPSTWPVETRALLTSAVLADVLDALGHRASALPHTLRPLKPGWTILGRAATASAVTVAAEPARPYEGELECVDNLKPGEVLVATTNGHVDSALWGELLSTAARARGAVGVILDGFTRDAARILAMDFPVFATGYHPLDSKGRLDVIHHGTPIRIGACVIHPGDWVLADIDGIVVAPQRLAEQAFERALEKVRGENKVRDELQRGRSVREVFAEYGIL